MIFCLFVTLVDQFVVGAIVFLYVIGSLAVGFLNWVNKSAAASGKYISKEVSAHTDASEGIPPRSAPQVEPSGYSEAPGQERMVLGPRYLTGMSSPSPVSTRLVRCSYTWNPVSCPTASSLVPSSGAPAPSPVASLQAETDTSDETVDGCVSLEDDDSLQIEPEIINGPTSGQTPVEATNDEVVQIERKSGGAFELESRTIGSLTDGWGIEEEEDDESPRVPPRVGAGLVLRRLVKPEVVSEVGGWLSRLSIAGQGCPTPKSTVQRVVRDRVAKLRSKRSQVDGVPAKRRGVTKRMAGKPQRSEKKEARGDSAAETGEKMVGLEFETIEATMIGSDVDGEMEMDETPDSDGDCSSGHEDPMQLDEDGPADSMQLEEDGPQAGSSASKGKKPQYDRVKVPFETLRGRYERGIAGLGFRQSSENEVSSRKIVSGPVGAPAQLSSQQHAAPVSTSVTRSAANDAPQAVAQDLVSTNSVADLREARRGKRAETRETPDQVAGPSPSTTADGNTSDTTPSTTTPASTLPSSPASTAPASPSATNTNASAPERQDRKRGCEESAAELEKDTRDQRVLGSGPAKISATRRVLLAKAGKRNLRKGAKAGTAVDGPRVEASGSSRGSEPETPESSKRVQRERPRDAEADQEVVPLNEVADKTLTGKFIFRKRTPSLLHTRLFLDLFLKQHPSIIILVEEGVLTLNIAEQELVAQAIKAAADLYDHDFSSDEESP